MKTLAFSHERRTPPAIKHKLGAAGFTLLEMLVVVFIIGITSTVVVPQLPLMMDRLDFALKRESFEQALDGLAYQAFSDNQSFVLEGRYDAQGLIGKGGTGAEQRGLRSSIPSILSATDQPRESQAPVVMADFAPVLPEGWELVVDEPIYFRGSGYCTGGTAALIVGRIQYA
ncbi:MAG: prepilin-type N-terminal cleavage/methylation domain-containing protein, partial [Rhodospirillaceae bacterium]